MEPCISRLKFNYFFRVEKFYFLFTLVETNTMKQKH
jgi:hypothetical protein